jgi:chemotaxis protein MotB
VRNAPVIVVRRLRRPIGAGIHGSAWKVAYADFVTALMAFFLVMWLVGQGQTVRQAVAGYFRNPGGFEGHTGRRVAGPSGADTALLARGHEARSGVVLTVGDRERLERTADRLRDLLGQLPEFERLGNQIEIQVTPEGLRVELLEASEATFFDTGSAALKPETVRILSTIARELGRLENDVVLEGHTDSRPYANAGGYSNWELSADRANAARRVMERGGLRARQVKGVRGYASTRPRVADRPRDPRNRRISIILQSSGAESAVRAADIPSREPAPRAR